MEPKVEPEAAGEKGHVPKEPVVKLPPFLAKYKFLSDPQYARRRRWTLAGLIIMLVCAIAILVPLVVLFGGHSKAQLDSTHSTLLPSYPLVCCAHLLFFIASPEKS